jgi:hypothetical protein
MRIILILLIFLTIPVWAQPRGQYLLGEHDGEDFVFYLTFVGKKVQLKGLGNDMSGETELVTVREHMYRFTLPFPEEPREVTLIEAGNDEIVLSSSEESEVLRGYKTRELPRWLFGNWKMEGADQSMEFSKSGVTLRRESDEVEAGAVGVAPQGPVTRLILFRGTSDDESVLLHLFRLEDNLLLVWDQDDGKVKRFNREGWMK